MKLFLDVGGHVGQTLHEVVNPKYGFDKIYTFEPAPNCWPYLEDLAASDPRIELCRYGLWNETCRKELHGAGGMGASIYADADAVTNDAETAAGDHLGIDLVRAASWLDEHTKPGDIVFMKLNCEGSECDVIEDLLDSGLMARLYNVMIDFDIRDVASMRWREGVVRKRLRTAQMTNVCFTEDVMVGKSHQNRIGNWLKQVGGDERLALPDLRERYAARLRDLSSRRGYRVRLESMLRRTVFARIPAPLKSTARALWRVTRWAS